MSLMKNPLLINREDNQFLEKTISEYPFFATSHILLAKGLLNIESFRYNKKLKKAALYSTDRKKLFKIIVHSIPRKTSILTKKTKRLTTNLNIGAPLEFNEKEEKSFSEWLSITKIKKIDRKNNTSKTDLIDDFIEQDPNIKLEKNKFYSSTKQAKDSLIEKDELVTETLARVYLEQEHFEKSIEAYKRLILKYPKKSSFFADQINLINDLKKK